MGEGEDYEEYQVPQGTVLPGRSSWPHPFDPWGPNDEKVFKQETAKGVRDDSKLADAVFNARHPCLKGLKIKDLMDEWRFLSAIAGTKAIIPPMDLQPLIGPQHEFDYNGQEPGMHHRHKGRWARHNGTIVVHL
jgi:hypothetical protein